MANDHIDHGFYDHVYDTLLSMPRPLMLAYAEYDTNFVCHVSLNNNWDYRDPGLNVTYETILVGKVHPALCGICFSTKGTYYIQSVEKVAVPHLHSPLLLIIFTA